VVGAVGVGAVAFPLPETHQAGGRNQTRLYCLGLRKPGGGPLCQDRVRQGLILNRCP
jgi:hypothetical protein